MGLFCTEQTLRLMAEVGHFEYHPKNLLFSRAEGTKSRAGEEDIYIYMHHQVSDLAQPKRKQLQRKCQAKPHEFTPDFSIVFVLRLTQVTKESLGKWTYLNRFFFILHQCGIPPLAWITPHTYHLWIYCFSHVAATTHHIHHYPKGKEFSATVPKVIMDHCIYVPSLLSNAHMYNKNIHLQLGINVHLRAQS